MILNSKYDFNTTFVNMIHIILPINPTINI